jgi:hypothetical protein
VIHLFFVILFINIINIIVKNSTLGSKDLLGIVPFSVMDAKSLCTEEPDSRDIQWCLRSPGQKN